MSYTYPTQDHLAQMQELLGRMPKAIALGGHYSLELFNRKGELRNIRHLKFWGERNEEKGAGHKLARICARMC